MVDYQVRIKILEDKIQSLENLVEKLEHENHVLRVEAKGSDLIVPFSLDLPRRERDVLGVLMKNYPKVVSHEYMLNAMNSHVNDLEPIDSSSMYSHVSKLRKKLNEILGVDTIVSRRFVGYKLTDEAYTQIIEMVEKDKVHVRS